jgi:hypothetical protein
MRAVLSDRAGIAATTLVLVVLLVVVALVRFTDVGRLVPGLAADCVLDKGGTSVDLTRAKAEQLTEAVARGAAPRLRPASLTCRHGGSDERESDRLDPRGLTARAEAVRRDLRSSFGPVRFGGFAPGGVTTGHMPGSAHYEGRAVDVFFRPINRENKRRGWQVAQYLVAHAERFAIDTVIFDDRIWTARRADEGWRDYRVDTSGRSRATARILQHRDHVHVDVAD